MSASSKSSMKVAIACGGTGGHFFPGVAVGKALIHRGNDVLLIASEKSVDREGAKGVEDARIEFLPAVAMVRGRLWSFFLGLSKAIFRCLRWFWHWRPDVVLVMGGFTSVAPAMVGRLFGARVFLHEANSIPGRANRILARLCHGIFVGFPAAQSHFPGRHVQVTGTPVRAQFQAPLPNDACEQFGLIEGQATLLVMGGSQGAQAINELMLELGPILSERYPTLQFVHLTGRNDNAQLTAMYQKTGARYVVAGFCEDTTRVVRLASAVISRAGASSLAEFAVVGLPSLLVPYPSAVDDHQEHNALSFSEDGAAIRIKQSELDPPTVAEVLGRLLFDSDLRASMTDALGKWDSRMAAEQIADSLLGDALNRSGDIKSLEGSYEGLKSSGNESVDRSNFETRPCASL